MSGLLGSKSPSASFNLWQSGRSKKKQLPAGVVSQTSLPVPKPQTQTPMTPGKYRVPYG